uniref:Alba domain-containing protein n=1 Tax=Mesocestoides corti TaxID=53468 RepID=A0A5K3FDC8_MESCO
MKLHLMIQVSRICRSVDMLQAATNTTTKRKATVTIRGTPKELAEALVESASVSVQWPAFSL